MTSAEANVPAGAGGAPSTPAIAPYGSWRSPISADLLVGQTVGLSEIALDGDDVYWLEARPYEAGRSVIVRRMPDGQVSDVTPPGFNARTRVHEYGGGAYAVHGGIVYFSNFGDQRLYRQVVGGVPEPLTPESPAQALRYADGVVDTHRGRLICVREDHTHADEPVNTIVAVDLGGASLRDGGKVLVAGNDFYAAPRLSADGTKLAWLTWNHPNMPWDGTELWVATLLPDGMPAERQRVAGGPRESIFQPEWSPDGDLSFISDRSGWWNLYRWRGGRVERLTQREAEFGAPQWVFGLSTYAFESAGRLICRYVERGEARLASLETATARLEPLAAPFTSIGSVRAAAGRVFFIGGSPQQAPAVVRLDLATGAIEVLRRSSTVEIDPGYLSIPETIEFPTEGGHTAFAFYYRPKNRDVIGPPGEQPPLLVHSHGGPTSASTSTLNLQTQFWTSRGFAVVDVNYGGSTGYGRAYRERLRGQWGIVDLDDCVNAARYLVARGEVDPRRLAIAGGSAGGYTTLCALTFRDLFSAGASYYGVSDLEALAKDTHKFESRYLDGLIGPYPERRDLYVARSPIHFVERLSCPVIFFQGLDDPIVPPDQAERMVRALRAKGLPVAYLAFEGERHGFRKAEHIKRAIEAELSFYGRVFGFQPAGPIEPVPIENLPNLP